MYQKICLASALDLGITDFNVLTTLNKACLFGNLHTLILDDIVDNSTCLQYEKLKYIYIAKLYYLEYIYALKQLFNNEECYWKYLHKYEKQTYIALYHEESKHVFNLNAYGEEDLKFIGWKCAPVKSVMAGILSSAKRLDLLEYAEKMVDNASIGFLLLDDFRDWEEDLMRSRFTYPLTLSLLPLNKNIEYYAIEDLKKIVFKKLTIGQQYYDILDTVLNKLQEAMKYSEKFPTVGYFINAQMEKIKKIRLEHTEKVVLLCNEIAPHIIQEHADAGV